MVATTMRGTPAPAEPRENTSYNQAKHFSVAQEARSTNDPLGSYLAGTFEIAGPLDREALEAALLFFVRRHEVLRSTFHQLSGELSCDTLGPDEVALKSVEVGSVDSAPELRDRLHRFFQRVDPVSGPLLVMGAVIREESTTVCFACDHLVTDGISTPLAVRDIATAYAAYARGERPELPEAGSCLAFSREQHRRRQEIGADDPRLDYWRTFMAGNGGFFPPFPLDLGVEPGRVHPTVNETDQLLTAEEVDAMDSRCRAAGGRLFMGILAAVGVSLRKEGGPAVYRGLMPVSERGRDSYAHAMGWFVNTLPIAFSVAEDRDFTEVMTGVRDAAAEMREHVDVPFVRAWHLLAPQYAAMRHWPYPVNFFSYLDFRRVPGARHHTDWKAGKHIWASHSNGICFWFHRNDTGLYVNSLYADTPQARRTKPALTRTLTQTLHNVTRTGTL